MPSEVTLVEAGLIHAYRSAAEAPEKATIIHRYAEITHLSVGRAEDALDLWVHLLDIAGLRSRLATPLNLDLTSSS